MSNPDKKKRDVKKKIVHEVTEYWIIVCYLALVFAAFTQYRRLILAAHDITYTNYGVAVIEALVLAKVVMIADVLRLGRRLEHKPLIYLHPFKDGRLQCLCRCLYPPRACGQGPLEGEGITGGLTDLLGKGHHELLAGCLVTFVAFIPFFAMRELGRVLGEGKIQTLFFRRRGDQ